MKKCKTCGTVWQPEWTQCRRCIVIRNRLRRHARKGDPGLNAPGPPLKYVEQMKWVKDEWRPRAEDLKERRPPAPKR